MVKKKRKIETDSLPAGNMAPSTSLIAQAGDASDVAASEAAETSQTFQMGIAAVDALSTDLSIPMIGDPNVRNIPRLSDGSAVEQVAFDVDDQSLSTDQDLENTIMDPNTAE